MVSSVVVSGDVPTGRKLNPAGAVATATSGQVLTSGVTAVISFTTEIFDNDNMFTATASIMTCRTDGVYDIKAYIHLPGVATGLCVCILNQNGVASAQDTRPAAASSDRWTISDTMYLVDGDTVSFSVFQNSGANRTITTARLAAVQIANA